MPLGRQAFCSTSVGWHEFFVSDQEAKDAFENVTSFRDIFAKRTVIIPIASLDPFDPSSLTWTSDRLARWQRTRGHGELWIATSFDPLEMPPGSRSSAVSVLFGSRLLFDRCSDPFGGELSFLSSIRVGFIGLGNMGFHMATNLINAGYTVTVHDIDAGTMKKFSERGVPAKETPREVAESSDVIITMLPSSSNVLDVYTGQNGLLSSGNHLSPDPQTSRLLSAKVSKYHLKGKKGYAENPIMLDAPVSGGVPAAEAGTLTFMIGGMEEAYLAAKPLFLSMGKNTIYCGGTGNGVAAKLCNNLAMAISMLGVSEAFALGQSLGITASTLTKVFNSSSARCWSSDSYNPVPGVMSGVPSSRNYDGGFTSKLMAKDLTLAMAAAMEVGFKCPITSEAYDIYKKMCEEGFGSKDFSCVFRHYYSGLVESTILTVQKQMVVSGINGGMDLPGGLDASGRKGKGKGVYQFVDKYGANVDGYSPIYDTKDWSPSGDVYVGGSTGLLIWAVTLAGLLAGGVLLVYNTSALVQ
ncbi:3-hydroxyisobutyrate dehydrogenase [Musa troglodytarum]|uniref:3-hydroxyisobutyrate dehydrogenase n=1 Tax=Musa troglodytarum TaxID=320322 RepID=A0A9E7H647_9LILI|nr:3-hydroxyisobutyrate dehydrogenase [Musa troglodytarum]